MADETVFGWLPLQSFVFQTAHLLNRPVFQISVFQIIRLSDRPPFKSRRSMPHAEHETKFRDSGAGGPAAPAPTPSPYGPTL